MARTEELKKYVKKILRVKNIFFSGKVLNLLSSARAKTILIRKRLIPTMSPDTVNTKAQ